MIQYVNPSCPDEVAPATPSIPFLFDQLPPQKALRVSVVVPVRNEADHLWQTLDALRNQQDNRGVMMPPDSYEVLLLTNNCTDHSYEVARQYQTLFPRFLLHIANISLSPDKANIGHVRRLLMDEACRRLLLIGNAAGIIASTDGDTVVDSTWISQTIAEINEGNDAVGGRILTRSAPFTGQAVETLSLPDRDDCSYTVRRYHLLDVTYRHLVARVEDVLDPCANDPWPRHFQHFGASLAVTCATYLKAGRLPEVPYLEDEAFYQAMLRIDARIRKSPQVKVFTSARTKGRVAVGFSWQLDQWATMSKLKQLPLVEGATEVVNRFRQRRQLRDCWQTMAHTDRRADLQTLASELKLDVDWLCRETATSQYFGQLYERVRERVASSDVNLSSPGVPITTAIQELRAFLR